jgi:hypothetical protein
VLAASQLPQDGIFHNCVRANRRLNPHTQLVAEASDVP